MFYTQAFTDRVAGHETLHIVQGFELMDWGIKALVRRTYGVLLLWGGFLVFCLLMLAQGRGEPHPAILPLCLSIVLVVLLFAALCPRELHLRPSSFRTGTIALPTDWYPCDSVRVSVSQLDPIVVFDAQMGKRRETVRARKADWEKVILPWFEKHDIAVEFPAA
ncbi:MAG: hypothetical protein AAF797_10020 [Planctomycetota bacterium]